MEFRQAVPADIPQLCALRRQQLIDEGQEPALDLSGPMARFFSSMMEEDRLVEFLALEGGDIVATGAVCFYPFPPSFTNPTGQFGYLTNMYTSPGFRGRGLATRMLDLAVAECRRRGVVRLFLAASQMGRPVYERYGFKAAGNWYSLSLG